MIKNLGKLKQWTGERLGAAKATLQTDDFQRLEADTERKRANFEKVHQAAGLFHAHLSKKKPSPEDSKSKIPPMDALGSCWVSYGSVFADDSGLGAALTSFGQAESKIAMLQDDFANVLKENYMATLEGALQEYKEYQSLKKKLESRRLDYDAKLSRLQKAKKEKPELEQEMQAAKIKYEETEYDLIQKMVYLQEYEETHMEALYHLLEAQQMYFSRALELLENVRANWGQRGSVSVTTPQQAVLSSAGLLRSPNNSPGANPRAIQQTNGEDYFTQSERSDVGMRSPSNSYGLPQRQITTARQTSSDSLSVPGPRRVPSAASIMSNNSSERAPQQNRQPPPSVPRRQATNPVRRRKALYDFEGENMEELSFRAGDVITVIEEVDEGWWLGEVEHYGPKRRGIFPVNYTEDLVTGGSSSSPSRIQEQPVEDYSSDPQFEEASPFNDSSAVSHENSNSSYGRPNHPAFSNSTQTPAEAPRNTTYIPYDTKPINAASPTTATVTRASPTDTTQTYSNTSSSAAAEPPCQECGCNDFSANVFKKGHCKTCFHKHQ